MYVYVYIYIYIYTVRALGGKGHYFGLPQSRQQFPYGKQICLCICILTIIIIGCATIQVDANS